LSPLGLDLYQYIILILFEQSMLAVVCTLIRLINGNRPQKKSRGPQVIPFISIA
jgi:hypothetical protein